jgi:Putative prokaryotic signal transducing protein
MGGKSKLVAVFSGNYLQAQIVKGRLESEGVPSMLRYEGAGLIYGITVDGLGEARVMVPEDLVEQAETILADQEYEEPDNMTDDEPSEQP